MNFTKASCNHFVPAIGSPNSNERRKQESEPCEMCSGIDEPLTVITVRLPKTLHESLKIQAHDFRTSLNKLCVAKLEKPLGEVHGG